MKDLIDFDFKTKIFFKDCSTTYLKNIISLLKEEIFFFLNQWSIYHKKIYLNNVLKKETFNITLQKSSDLAQMICYGI